MEYIKKETVQYYDLRPNQEPPKISITSRLKMDLREESATTSIHLKVANGMSVASSTERATLQN